MKPGNSSEFSPHFEKATSPGAKHLPLLFGILLLGNSSVMFY